MSNSSRSDNKIDQMVNRLQNKIDTDSKIDNWARRLAEKTQKEAVGSTVSEPLANQTRFDPLREGRKMSIYDSFGGVTVPDKAMRMAETARAEAEAKTAKQAYDEYVAGADYQQYLNEQRKPYAAGTGAAMGQGSNYAPGIQAQQKQAAEDPRETKAKELKARADYAENLARQQKDSQILADDMEEFQSWPEEDREALKAYLRNRNQQFYDLSGPRLDSAEFYASALIGKYGIDKIRQMAESYSRWENEQNSQTLVKEAEEYADKSPILSSVDSVVAGAIGNFTGALGYAGELAGRTGRFSTLDPNNMGQLPAVASGAIRDKVTEKIRQTGAGGVGATVYQAGMSAADNLARMVLGWGSGSLGIAAMGSFGQTMSDASGQGARPMQAMALSTASSIFEVLTEKVSLDNLLSQAAGGKQSLKQLIKSAVKAGGVEITEEGMSFVLNQIADNAIMGGNSGFNRTVGQLLAEGMSIQQAREEAAAQIMAEAAQTAIISGLSGGMMSGVTGAGTNALHTLADHRGKKNIRPETESMILKEGEVEGLSLPTPGVTVNSIDRVKQKFIEQAGRLSKATGREIVFYTSEAEGENGYFHDGKIYVNTRSGNPVAQIVSHELTHSAEFSDAYKELSRVVFDRIGQWGADVQSLRRQKREVYARNGHALRNDAEVDQEIVAEFVEQYLLTDEETILSVAGQNRSLGQRILGWIDGFLAKLGSKDAQERKFLNDARNLWAKALKQSQAAPQAKPETTAQQSATEEDGMDDILQWAREQYAAGNMTEEEFDGIVEMAMQQEEMEASGEKYSFAGPNARTADINALQTARQLDEQGVANETIRQQTGWFKGMDGKWRFEIDDSGMKYSRRGDLGFRSRNAEYDRYRTLTEKAERFMLGQSNEWLSMEEQQELTELQVTYRDAFRQDGRMSPEALPQNKLSDYIQHDALFDAYPQLKEAKIVFAELAGETRGQYDPEKNIIRISEDLRDAPQDTLIHEIQHAIQGIENFTSGASVEYWKEQRKDIVETIAAARRNLDMWLNDIGYKKVQRESLLAASRREKTMEQHWKDMAEFKANSKYARQIAACEEELAEFQRQYDEITHGMTAYDQYLNTAGEIEARDAAGRRNLSAQEREKKPPILGGEDTVFADETGISFDQQVSEYPYDMQTVIHGYMDAVDEGVLSFIEEVQNGQAWKGKKITVGTANSRMVRDIADLTGVQNTEGCKILMNSNAVEHIQKRHGVNGAHDNTMRNNRDIARINYILQNYDSMELSPRINGEYKNRKGTRSPMVVLSKKINGTYFVIEAVPDTGKIGIVSAYMDKNRASQVPDENTPGRNVQDELASALNNSLPDEGGSVKQFSISAADKRGIASDLRSILNRGGDPAELRRYIGQLERGTGAAEQTGRNAQQSGAQRIIQAARRNGISVQEYLQQNWEQYEVDGEWNREAREALEAERRGRRYSISDTRELDEVEQNAVKLFGTTKRFEEAGFILPDGQLLRMTDNYHNGERYYDHRAIAKAYGREVDLETNHGFNADNNKYLDKFVEAGNIRFDAGEPDLDMDIGLQLSSSVPLTRAQERTIRDLVEWKENRETDFEANMTEENFLYSGPLAIRIDFGADSNYAVGSASAKDLAAWGKKALEYKGRKISASQIIHDTRRFYETGETMQRSNLNQFRYSISETEQKTGERKAAAQIREEMPEKARSYLAGAERRLLNDLGGVLDVTKFQNREKLQGIVREIADEYLEQGRVREERMDFLFDQAYAEGIVEDASMVQQYGEIRNHLRTTGVTLSRQDQADIADFQDFRKRAYGTVRIVNDGLPVDSAYHELHEMAPNLFPESITHPADQLVRMYEVGQSIRVSEKTLRQFHGSEAENYRKWARNDFDDVINSAVADLRSVREVAEEAEQKLAEKAAAPTTPEEAKEAYKQLKDARKTYEKALAKNLLTESDEIQVGRLLRGEILPEHLNPEKDNIRAITAVYEAKKDYERLTKLIAEYKKHIRSERLKKADAMLETAGDWKDKKVGIAYSRETMERNVYDIVPDRAVAEQVNETYFRPVHEAEAMATRFKNQHRDLVRKLNLSRKVQKGNLVSEAHAVQLLGEAEDNIRVLRNSRGRMKQRDGKTIAEWQSVIDEMWRESPGLDEQKIRGAVSEFRKIYDQLFQQMNEVRVRNGYEPVNYRQGYFPHFQPGEGDGVLAHFGKIMGIDTQVAALPTTINGLTHTFKPGIQWFGNAQERLGFNTAYDAVEGFDKYIEGVASVIFQTDNIQNLRALESQIRYRTSDEGIRKQVDAVNNDPRLTEEEKQIKINAIYEHGRYTLSNFVIELNEYTNLLANKKSKLDRTTEALIGRRAYTIMKNWESRVGANMIAGNISSALTNFIPLTQAGAQLSSDAMLKGMWDTLKAMKEDDGITGQSTFLTNRRGSDPLVKTWAQTASEKLGMSFLMDLVDGFTSDSIVRAAYYQNLKKGLSQAEAMHQADIFASSVMADRSKGAMPTLFESTNPVFKMFTQFQLEVNNQFSEIFKDLPRRFREKGLIVMGGVLMKYFIGAFLFNELYEFFAGRRPALDPISMLNDTVGDLTGYEMPNVIEWISGGDVSFETEQVGLAEAGMNLAGSALGELPFSSGLTMLGIETDGGRLPASSAVPDLTALWQAATEEDWSSEKRWKEVKDELGKLMYVIPPFGGNQAQKLWKGVKAYLEGGSYSVDKEGNDILQYPVYKDSPEDAFWNLVRSAFLGKSSLPEAQDWVDSGFDSLGAKQTAVYQDLVAAGAGDREAFRVLQELQLAAKTEDSSKATVQRKLLRESGLSGDAKAIVYYGMYASDAERELMDSLADSGADMGVSLDVIMGIKDINADDSMKGAAASNAKRDLIANAALTDEEKKMLYRKFISDSRDDDIALFEGAGLGFDEFLKAHSAYTTINEGSGKASQKALEFAKWVSDQDYSVKQEGLVRETFSYYSMVPADAAKYDKLMDAGLDSEDAYELASDMAELEPEAGTDEVSDLQRWRLCVDAFSNEMFQLSSLCGYMTADQYEKVERAYSFGVKPKSYVTMKERLPQYDSDRNGSITQAEAKAAIDGMNVSNDQKAVLWQMVDSGWSAKNNPYNKEIGQKVKDSKK